jgi:uncharacterized protein YbcI
LLTRASTLVVAPGKGFGMTDLQPDAQPSALVSVSSALVSMHKEQFGRGPSSARTHYAGPDALLCILEDALLPAERAMVEMGDAQRVRESRSFLQAATAGRFIERVEQLTGRTVRAFSSATDPDAAVVMEIFVFEPQA